MKKWLFQVNSLNSQKSIIAITCCSALFHSRLTKNCISEGEYKKILTVHTKNAHLCCIIYWNRTSWLSPLSKCVLYKKLHYLIFNSITSLNSSQCNHWTNVPFLRLISFSFYLTSFGGGGGIRHLKRRKQLSVKCQTN